MDGKGGGTSQPSFAIRIYIYFVLFRSSIVKWRADIGLEYLLACVLLSSRNAIRSNKICFEAIIYKYCLVLFVFRRDDEANFFE